MKKLTGTMVAVLLLAGLAATAAAQHQHGRHADASPRSEHACQFDRQGDRLERMTACLDLTDEQVAAIDGIIEDGRAQAVAVRKDVARLRNQIDGAMLEDVPSESDLVGLTEKMGSLRTQLQVIRLKTRLAVRAQLTDEQRDRWLLSKPMHQRHDRRPGRAPHFPRGQHEGRDSDEL